MFHYSKLRANDDNPRRIFVVTGFFGCPSISSFWSQTDNSAANGNAGATQAHKAKFFETLGCHLERLEYAQMRNPKQQFSLEGKVNFQLQVLRTIAQLN